MVRLLEKNRSTQMTGERFHSNSNSNKVIAIYLDALQGYGADVVLLKIANGLAQRNYAVDLILSKTAVGNHISIDPSIRVVDLGGSRFTPIRNVVALSAYLKRRRPDILFSSIHFNNIVAAAALGLSGIQCKLILRQANTLRRQFKDYPIFVPPILYSLTYWAYKRADLVISQCTAMVSDLTQFMKVDEEKIKVIYNPTITADIFEKAKAPIRQKWLTEDTQYPVVLAVGRLKLQKDFETLIRAFGKLKAHYSAHAKLIILGEGPLRATLEALATELGIREDVDFIGFHENPYAFMYAADVYVSSSRYEGLPNSLIEALALGKRVVATACQGGTVEILKYGQYGKLVPVGNPDIMAKSIAEALISPNPARPAATRNFEHESQIHKYCEVFSKVFDQLGDSNSHLARRPRRYTLTK